jgi:molybdate transport system substrate-binding protein
MMTINEYCVRWAACLALPCLIALPAYAGEVNVAVTADLAEPMQRIATLFQKQSGHTVKQTPGANDRLYAQIKKGASFDVLLSADEEIPRKLMQDGLAVGGTRFVYAIGRLVLWSAQSDLVDDKGKVLNSASFVKLAMANPRYSPYGTAAKETLTELTMWNAMQRRLDKRDDVVEAYQLAVTERAELALVALSQVMRDGKISTGSWWIVPETMHEPIRQSAVLLSGAQDVAAAKEFLTFMKSDKVRAVLRGFGYALP